MQGPGGRNHGLIVLHDNVAGLLGLAHQVHDDAAFRQVEVSIDLHAALVGVGRHAVPDAARLQLSQAHGQLAGFQHVRVDELVDDPLIGGLGAAQGALVGVLDGDEGGLAVLMGRSRDQVEAGGSGLVIAAEHHVSGAAGDVEAVLKSHLIADAVGLDPAGAAQVEHACFPAFQEEVGTEVCPHVNALVDGQGLLNRHDAQNHHAVHMGVDSLHRVGLVQVLDEELLAEFLGGVSLDVVGACGIANIHSKLPQISTGQGPWE